MIQWRSLHHRLLLVVALGLLATMLSLASLVRIFLLSTVLRTERAREVVAEELTAIGRRPPSEASATPLVGLRAGLAPPVLANSASTGELRGVPPTWQSGIAVAQQKASASGKRTIIEVPIEGDTVLVAGALPPVVEGQPFAAYVVLPPTYARTWRAIVVALGLTTLLVVAATLHAVRAVRRGADLLQKSITVLGDDLTAVVPRPEVQELSVVADGIADLASKLKAAREAEEVLQRELAQRERLAALGRVVTGVAHEVRNPLASIKLRLDLAAALPDMPDGGSRALAHATSEIERLDRLVADLLVVAGRATGPKKTEDVGALVEHRVEALAPWAASHGVTLRAEGMGSAAIDRDSVTRAIDNLVRNAVEASPHGAEVSVHVQPEDDAVEVAVADRGAGVDGGRVAELFEPCFTTKSEGTGLGLALSRSIARAHGGELVYERRDGITRFAFTLSRIASSSAPSSPPRHLGA